jgi:hypothetical protein
MTELWNLFEEENSRELIGVTFEDGIVISEGLHKGNLSMISLYAALLKKTKAVAAFN